MKRLTMKLLCVLVSFKKLLFFTTFLALCYSCFRASKIQMNLGTIHKERTLYEGEGVKAKGYIYCFYDVILLFKSVQGERGCLIITKFERTYFMDVPLAESVAKIAKFSFVETLYSYF